MDVSRITLLTDFGLRDGYVAAMKGVIATIAPEARVVDITHEIPPQSIRRGGIVWESAAPWFPEGTIHLAVVDPGVGSRRRIVAVRARGFVWIAPDNGILGHVLEGAEIEAAHDCRRRALHLPRVSDTFHGRDIFAPVAAHLARGEPLDDVGPRIDPATLVRDGVPRTKSRRAGGEVVEVGEIVDVDRFGNAMTNVRPRADERIVEIRCGELRLRRLSRSYASVAPGRPLVIVGSAGYVEFAVRDGDAATVWKLEQGQEVRVRWRPPRSRTRADD